MAAEAVTYGGSRFSDTAELETDAIMSGSADGHGAMEEELSSGDEDVRGRAREAPTDAPGLLGRPVVVPERAGRGHRL